jgi:hypothetical protein
MFSPRVDVEHCDTPVHIRSGSRNTSIRLNDVNPPESDQIDICEKTLLTVIRSCDDHRHGKPPMKPIARAVHEHRTTTATAEV